MLSPGLEVLAVTDDAAATTKLDVFLSYKREERDVAEALAKFLITRGYDVWWDAALLAGEDFARIVHAELTQARAVVVLWSKQARNSYWVRAEAKLALEHGTLINAVIDGMAFEGIPPEYSDIQAVRLGEDVAAFHEAIAGAIARKGTAPSQTGRSVAEAVATLEGKVKDAEFFGVIANSTQIVDFEEYLQNFGLHAQFANMAKRRIQTLKREEKKRQSLYTRLKAAGASFVVVLGAGVSLEQFFGIKFTRMLGIESLFQPATPEQDPVSPDPPVVVPEDAPPAPDPGFSTVDGLSPNMVIWPKLDIESLYNQDPNGSAAALPFGSWL
ncbi:MAG: toll/interleukin-1 receptor domain-containing protein [Hyphomicrobiales bacterium]|nr:MAG: toll/interleukin-1 receptor domain-containing protein [Hyphomicrobiales bacterium]